MSKSRVDHPLTRRRFVASALAAGAGIAFAASPRALFAADGQPKVEIVVLYATQNPKGGKIDAKISKEIVSQLTQPPFSSYNTYEFVDKQKLGLDAAKDADPWKGKPTVAYTLANGRALAITLIEIVDNRFHVGAEIKQAGGASFLKLLEVKAAANETFFVAGQSYKDGILVVGMTIKP